MAMTPSSRNAVAKGVTLQRRAAWNPLALQQQLTGLAAPCIAQGMTAKNFERLARYAFVQAATKGSTFVNGRVNYSRVAARTGLTRAEVKRVLSASNSWLQVRNGPLERVILGWRTDRHFIDPRRRPRRLVIAGHRRSFANLTKRYAKDVPPKAVLEELRRIGAVVISGTSVKLNTRLSVGALQVRKRLAADRG